MLRLVFDDHTQPTGFTDTNERTQMVTKKKHAPRKKDAIRQDAPAESTVPARAEEILTKDELGTLFRGELETLVKSPKAELAFKALEQFAEIDYRSHEVSTTAGEIFSSILDRPLDEQKRIVWAMADAYGIDRPSYQQSGAGRPTQGRNELASVVYHNFPDLLVKDRGKDTRAGKRITDHVRRYKAAVTRSATSSSSATTTQGQTQVSGATDRALKTVFVALWEKAENENERRTLVALYLRVGVAPESMDKWTDRGLLRLAAAPLAAVTMDSERKAVG